MFYFVKTPLFFKWIFRGCVWNLHNEEKTIYLSFDDGPHPEVTPLVLDILKELGIAAEVQYWESKPREISDNNKTAEYARIRLCLDSSKDEEIKKMLEGQEIAPRKLATIWWNK